LEWVFSLFEFFFVGLDGEIVVSHFESLSEIVEDIGIFMIDLGFDSDERVKIIGVTLIEHGFKSAFLGPH
jgi:hypothetical protein